MYLAMEIYNNKLFHTYSDFTIRVYLSGPKAEKIAFEDEGETIENIFTDCIYNIFIYKDSVPREIKACVLEGF